MRRRVRREREPLLLPAPDRVPIEMRQPVPGVAHIPRVQSPDVVRDEERGGGEAKIGEQWIGVLGEGSVAVVKRQQKCGMRSAECGMAGPESLNELVQREGLPTCPCQSCHLAREHRLSYPCDSELRRSTDAMITQHRRQERGPTLIRQFRIPHS